MVASPAQARPPSILFVDATAADGLTDRTAPACFPDLELDRVVDAVTAGRDEYDLRPFFYHPLDTIDAISYRHEVLRDLEETTFAGQVRGFAAGMRSMRKHLDQASKLRHRLQVRRWFLDAATVYTQTLTTLADELEAAPVKSRGFIALREHLTGYVSSTAFTSLREDAESVGAALASVRYCLAAGVDRIQVSRYEGEADYAAAVLATFARFRHGAVKDYRTRFNEWADMNHVEGGVLDRVALLFPDEFAALDRFCDTHRDFLDRTVADFDRQVQFYLGWLDYLRRLPSAGLSVCYPKLSATSKRVHVQGTFDLALATKLLAEESPVVCNDIALDGPERLLVVTGPNQGGKTTFARTFGQLHYLARLGCPVPGTRAQLFLCDQVFTHFERPENLTDMRGKLEDDLIRIHDIVSSATSRSVVIMNEIFTSTTFRDALFLGREILGRLSTLDALGVCVTFVDELSILNEKTVSAVAEVATDDPTVRTFTINRRPADGRAYAAVLADKYGLTQRRIAERLAQ
jgi:DNA mismatch repair protein MutS